ncbi:MAG: glycerophosphodiester phosphodiesterase family protein, partial [Clostridia bacterium]|nr:glycerophosphodiester phosphodiesterase family protein [Clostridia bacterium]
YYPTLMVPRVIEGCKEHQVAIHTWTVDEPEHIAWLIQSGVEAVITNKPDIALQIRQNVTKHYPS